VIDVLPHSVHGPEGRIPTVLLHGFAGDRQTWIGLEVALSTRHRTIAFDLPGHGAAVDWPRLGHAGVQAEEVVRSLDRLGVDRFHLVGHSMGGAVATITALRLAAAARVASLTLLAPGGFGGEIDADLLRRFAVATEPDEIARLMAGFFGPAGVPHGDRVARRIAEIRRDPKVTAALAAVAEAILAGGRQKHFDLDRLADLAHPIRLVWGEADRVLPIAQAAGVPGVVGVHRLAAVGHMPHLEAPRAVHRIVAEVVASAGA
jgi:pyruvate dehydrogenase E2 component (dihydrolipoamide acetyltransferase)